MSCNAAAGRTTARGWAAIRDPTSRRTGDAVDRASARPSAAVTAGASASHPETHSTSTAHDAARVNQPETPNAANRRSAIGN